MWLEFSSGVNSNGIRHGVVGLASLDTIGKQLSIIGFDYFNFSLSGFFQGSRFIVTMSFALYSQIECFEFGSIIGLLTLLYLAFDSLAFFFTKFLSLCFGNCTLFAACLSVSGFGRVNWERRGCNCGNVILLWKG